jgi:hypothetical protein
MLKNLRTGVLACLLIVYLCCDAISAPIQWQVGDGGNGHWYESINELVSWTTAKSNAEALGGYLTTITSAQENSFIWNNVDSPSWRWLGGLKNGNNWTWVTGEPWSYSNWYPGEPNNMGGYEYYLQFSPNASDGTWNDNSDSGFLSGISTGYIIEYNTTVPIPGPLLLLGSGLLGLIGIRRRSGK